MHDEHAAAVAQTVDGVLLHNNVAVTAVKLGQQVVMIARDVNDACAFARLPQNFLDDVVVLLWPITATAQLPDVRSNPDDVESFGFIVAQKIKQGGGVASTRT